MDCNPNASETPRIYWNRAELGILGLVWSGLELGLGRTSTISGWILQRFLGLLTCNHSIIFSLSFLGLDEDMATKWPWK